MSYEFYNYITIRPFKGGELMIRPFKGGELMIRPFKGDEVILKPFKGDELMHDEYCDGQRDKNILRTIEESYVLYSS